ncbi:16S rRNA (cytosine(1402)-N(4))-methyltransferase RsmH [Candidatus Parcubacteria bacterium]|nr:MAG: 16S rRNA (cytosine(1402)-N(4))-methyltransferase RsmH [Candidatus Parcubacteria bacterium]
MPHIPVLLQETLHSLGLAPGMFVIDATVGSGGHATAIMERIQPGGMLLGIDWDPEMARRAQERLAQGKGKYMVVRGNYAELPDILHAHGLPRADALLFDFGFSSEQLEMSERGFSFTSEGPLRLTYSPESIPAYEVLAASSEDELTRIFREFGEERWARRIARAVKAEMENLRVPREMTARRFAEIVARAVPRGKGRRIHPATRAFQALRIYVNYELDNIARAMANIPRVVAQGGRVAAISFHSLEDRIVKQWLQKMSRAGVMKILTKKPITPSANEKESNPRSRSAKLRAGELLNAV